ncbi:MULTISPECIES: metallothionein [Pseudomonas]|uniref:metallothionein n=1 Tax=Pseudomonas TaxID=286 RepID=UPI001B3390A7|nr:MULTISPECIES: metallothionein [Pseudomonas]MBP5967580.1 metallothionein [Pseudomonas iridis]UHC82211.1 metallothionein [Pseudomonas sp. NIBR-H-19]
MPDRKCDCPGCKCTIKDGEHAYAEHGKHYCCEACAHHHKGGEECSSKGCQCAHPK